MPDTLQHPFLRDTLAGRCVKTACGITLDIGRQRLTGRDLKGLLDLAEEKGVLAANAAMRSGEIVNPSENRPALHTALRDPSVSAPFHTEVMLGNGAARRLPRAALCAAFNPPALYEFG